MRTRRNALIVLGATVFVLTALAWLGQERLRDRATFPPASIHSLAPEGCALAYRYLTATAAQKGRAVHVLTQPIGWEPLAAGAVVFRLRPRSARRWDEELERSADDRPASGPTPTPTPTPAPTPPLLSAREERWIREGGRLVLGLDHDRGDVRVSRPQAGATVAKVFPVWPGVSQLLPPVLRVFAGPPTVEGHALFTSGPHALVWRRPMGRGELLLLSTPEVLENRALGKANHLALLSALAGASRTVYFDEDAHGLGQREGLAVLMLRWGFGPSLLLAGAAFALVVWRRRTPTGACEEAVLPQRSEAVDLVDSMAELYDRVLLRREALERYARSFERAVALRTGLTGRALATRVAALAGEQTPETSPGRELGASDFGRALVRLNSAFRRLEEHAHARRSR